MSAKECKDKAALWTRLQEIQKMEMEELKEERAKLEQEKEDMTDVAADSSDIIEINAGGEAIIQAHRSTLCLVPDSVFSHLFSGRWEDSCARDSHGRVFLDHDPELIRLIVNYLRIKRIEDPSHPIRSPKIPKNKKDDFKCLVHYFGLYSFFYPPFGSLDVSSLQLVNPHSSSILSTQTADKLSVTYNSSGHAFVACTPSIALNGEFYWKITIDSLPSGGWLYLGVIGNLNPTSSSYSDPTSNGWAGSNQVYLNGTNTIGYGDWSDFVQGECLHFHLNGDKLTMFSVNKNKAFAISNVTPQETFIHMNFHANGTKVTLAPLSEEEVEKFANNIR